MKKLLFLSVLLAGCSSSELPETHIKTPKIVKISGIIQQKYRGTQKEDINTYNSIGKYIDVSRLDVPIYLILINTEYGQKCITLSKKEYESLSIGDKWEIKK